MVSRTIELWKLKNNEKEKILIVLNNKFDFLFKQLNIVNTKSEVEKYI